MTSHYETLGVDKSAGPEEIKKAYRKMASKHHPDKGGDTATFQKIEEAYRILSDPDKRREYDDPAQPFNFQDFGNMHPGGMPPGMDDIFRQFGFHFGGFRQQQPKRNRDLRVNVGLKLHETLSAQKRVISLQTTNGTRETVSVEIPIGVNHSTQIKYPQLGDNFFNTLPRGDLYVHVIVEPDPRFQVHGIDLVTTVDINCLDAIIGCEAKFNSLDGKEFALTVPAGTQPGSKFKVTGHGLYAMNQPNIRGNLYLIANITVPTNLTEDKLDYIRKITTTK